MKQTMEQGRGELRGRTAAEIDRVECGMWNEEGGVFLSSISLQRAVI